MLLDNTNTNIPELSVGDVIGTLSDLYCNAINSDIPPCEVPASYLCGPMGVGKSYGIRQLAADIKAKTGKRTHITDVRLLLFSPVDLRGVPVATADGFSAWLKPKIFDMDPSEDCINILFLDELSAAPQSVQAAAYQITLDRVIGEHKLPDNCIVIAAGNRTTDKSVAYTMPKALCNRLLHFSIRSDVDSWLGWAFNNGIDSRIIGFISFDNSRLNTEPGTGDMAFSTPRSWEFVSKILKVMNPSSPSDVHTLISSAVGIDNALAFEEFCEIYPSLPSLTSIFRGSCKDYPRNHQVLYALISSLVTAIGEREDISLAELENVCAYCVHFPADFAMTFFTDLKHIDRVCEKLSKVRVFQNWITKNNVNI